MKTLFFGLALLAATTAVGPPAEAQNYPWCAHYGKGDGGLNCGFTSFQQCLTDISGIGGFCEQNNTYRPPATTPERHHALKPHSHRKS
jgi:hypothetical protein